MKTAQEESCVQDPYGIITWLTATVISVMRITWKHGASREEIPILRLPSGNDSYRILISGRQ